MLLTPNPAQQQKKNLPLASRALPVLNSMPAEPRSSRQGCAPDCSTAGPHDEAHGGGAILDKANAAHEVPVTDARGREEDIVSGTQVVGRQNLHTPPKLAAAGRRAQGRCTASLKDCRL